MKQVMWIFFALLLTTVAHGDAVIFSGNDVKALKQNLNLNGAVKVLSGTADPTSSAQNAPIGSLYLNTSSGHTYRKQDAGSSTNWVKVSAGEDATINYVKYPDAEQAITGWATYADAAGAQPVNGVGGSPTLTLTRTTSAPLRGLGSFLITKDAANRQGEGISYDFSVASSDQAKMISVQFDYSIASGTYADGDLTVYIYDTTNSTLIQPAPYIIQNITGAGKFRSVFQTASNSTGYRVIIHAASTSASAYTVKFDNVIVGPQAIIFGAPVTDWRSYTPTFTGFGTVTGISAFSRRVGDVLEFYGAATSGTAMATEARISLGYSGADSNVTTDSGLPTLHAAGIFARGAAAALSYMTLGEASKTYVTFGKQDGTNAMLAKVNGNALVGSAETFSWFGRIKITGWSSSVQMSNDADTRVVAASVAMTAQVIPATTWTQLTFGTTVTDTTGLISGNTFVVTTPGYYNLSAFSNSGAATEKYVGYTVNDATMANASNLRIASSNNYAAVGSALTAKLNAGDVIRIAMYSVAGETLLTASRISIQRISGPSAIAASESVNMRAHLPSGTVNSDTATPIVYATVDYDSHGAYNSSTGRFTAPTPGKYRVSVGGQFNSLVDCYIYKNAAVYSIVGTPDTTNLWVFGSDVVYLLAGEYIDIRAGASTVVSNASRTHLAIERIGN